MVLDTEVMMMLQRLIADAREMEAESSAAESEAQKDYETFGKDPGSPLGAIWVGHGMVRPTMQLLSRSPAMKLGVISSIWTYHWTTTGIYGWLGQLDAGY